MEELVGGGVGSCSECAGGDVLIGLEEGEVLAGDADHSAHLQNL